MIYNFVVNWSYLLVYNLFSAVFLNYNLIKCSSLFQLVVAVVVVFILFAQVKIFQSCQDGSSWVEPVLSSG